MSDYTQEQYDKLPEEFQVNYTKVGDVYRDAGFVKIKETANGLDDKNKAVSKELAEFKEQEQAKIDLARTEAYDKAIADKDIEGITDRHADQLEHSKASGHAAGKLEAQQEFKEKSDKDTGDSIALKIANAIAVDEFAADMLSREIRARIEVDGKEIIILSVDGSATTLTLDEFKAELVKSPRYSRLLKNDITTTGGGEINGGSKGSTLTKKPNEMNSAERLEFKRRDPSGFKQAFKL